MSAGHPSDLALMEHVLDRDDGARRGGTAAHVAACQRCAARVAEIDAAGAAFRQRVYPATVEAIEGAARTVVPLWRRRPSLLAAPALAAAAAIFLFVRSSGPSSPGATAVALALSVERAGRPSPVTDGGQVPLGVPMQFTVSTATGCRVWVVCAEDSGEIVRVHPEKGDAENVPRGGSTRGAVPADDDPGFERWYAICSPGPVEYATVESAVRAAVAGGSRVRDPLPLSGLPAGTATATLLVSKKS